MKNEELDMNENFSEKICAHRGYLQPENTLLAFENALKHGASWIEFDVHLTKDKEFIVWHDNTLKKLGINNRPENLAVEELKKIDLGKEQKMPTLREVLENFDGKINLNIELKTPYAGEELGEYLSVFTPKSDWIVSSFHPEALKELNKKHDFKLGVLYFLPLKNYFKIALDLNAYSINPFYWFATKKNIMKAHESDLKVATWTVDKPKNIEKLLLNRVDMIITNQLETALMIAKKLEGKNEND